jgi:hypothetical protein
MSWRDFLPKSGSTVKTARSRPDSAYIAYSALEDKIERFSSSIEESTLPSPLGAIPAKCAKPSTPILPLTDTPVSPLRTGWLIVYRDEVWRLRGGNDERAAGTVRECCWNPYAGWTVVLTNGDRVPLRAVRAVSKTDTRGRILAAWTVREHGYDGDGR